MTTSEAADRAAIDDVVGTFFAAFTSGPGLAERMDGLRALFLDGAVIVRTCGLGTTRYDVDGFVAPRQRLLADGGLVEFREWEESGRTDLFGDVAHRLCRYAKAGVQDGVPFTGRGVKSIQLVRTGAGWRISAAAWDDERDGVLLD